MGPKLAQDGPILGPKLAQKATQLELVFEARFRCHLEAVLKPSWARLGPVLGRKIGHFGPQVGHLGRKNVEASKSKKPTKTYGFSSICGLLRLRTWPKMAKKTALTSFWRPCRFGQRFEALLGPSWARLGPQLGPILGAKLASKTTQNCIKNQDEIEAAT